MLYNIGEKWFALSHYWNIDINYFNVMYRDKKIRRTKHIGYALNKILIGQRIFWLFNNTLYPLPLRKDGKTKYESRAK